MPLKRPVKSGSQIRIYILSTSTLVWWIDTRYSPDVFYVNNTLIFYVRNFQWTLDETYFVYLLEGVATSDQYCGIESPTFGGEYFEIEFSSSIFDLNFSQATEFGNLQFGIQQCQQQQLLPLQQPQQQYPS